MAKETTRESAAMKDEEKGVQMCIDSGVSFVARLKSTKEIVGIRLNLLLNDSIPSFGPTEEMVSTQSI